MEYRGIFPSDPIYATTPRLEDAEKISISEQESLPYAK
jgi:hypothetical protein